VALLERVFAMELSKPLIFISYSREDRKWLEFVRQRAAVDQLRRVVAPHKSAI
jgi:hypothetical protein